MLNEISKFIEYLHVEKNTTENTEVSYKRDLIKMTEYLKQNNINSYTDITKEVLEDYIDYLEEQGKASSTISRTIASMKNFFHYAERQNWVTISPAEFLKAPKLDKKVPSILTIEQMDCLLSQPGDKTLKDLRDKAMLELLYATGIRVSELINLKMTDVDMEHECINCHSREKVRVVPFGSQAKNALEVYMRDARNEIVISSGVPYLFTNCNGEQMSRQGFWKLIKYYAKKAGIEEEITPHTFRHSFAAHLLENGADLKDVQEMLGHADISTTQLYLTMKKPHVRDSYSAHPRR